MFAYTVLAVILISTIQVESKPLEEQDHQVANVENNVSDESLKSILGEVATYAALHSIKDLTKNSFYFQKRPYRNKPKHNHHYNPSEIENMFIEWKNLKQKKKEMLKRGAGVLFSVFRLSLQFLDNQLESLGKILEDIINAKKYGGQGKHNFSFEQDEVLNENDLGDEDKLSYEENDMYEEESDYIKEELDPAMFRTQNKQH